MPSPGNDCMIIPDGHTGRSDDEGQDILDRASFTRIDTPSSVQTGRVVVAK